MSTLSPLHRRTRAPIVIEARNPKAVAVCDGCGMWTMHESLVQKMEYRGGLTPVGTGLYVCGVCDDVPNPYFSKMVLGPDPVPVPVARSKDAFAYAAFDGSPSVKTTINLVAPARPWRSQELATSTPVSTYVCKPKNGLDRSKPESMDPRTVNLLDVSSVTDLALSANRTIPTFTRSGEMATELTRDRTKLR